ncbi:MAG: radical SAM protein, partial [Bacteroidota bacterium]
MYNLGDETYLNQPKKMSEQTVIDLMTCVREHCLEHDINRYVFSLHGGEPLLAGKDFFEMIVAKAEEILLPEITPSFSVQTNALLLTDDWCELLGRLNFDIGVSLDGTKESHDMYRVDKKGKGTYDRVIKGLKTAQASEHLERKPGILSVLNVDCDPVALYRHYKSLGISSIDVLFPDYTYDNPPPRKHYEHTEHPYGDWLVAMFNDWFADGKERPRVRIFEFIISLILGNDLSFDHLGPGLNELLVIETDGGIEAVDVLKACGHGFTKAGANVSTTSFNDALQTELAQMYYFSHQKMCQKCTVCPVSEVCGGGYCTLLAHLLVAEVIHLR